MSLTLHRAPDTATLATGLARVLRAPLSDPFAEEVIVVPARGVERWLSQQLSHQLGVGPRGGDGVSAGIRFMHPGSLVALVLGVERNDPWAPENLAWPVLQAIEANIDQEWCQPIALHLGANRDGENDRRGRRFAVARNLAHLFADYSTQRPALLTAWRLGRDEDGLGARLPHDLGWQAELWRAVIDSIDEPAPDQRLTQTLTRLTEQSLEGLALPGRLSLFGHTRLSVSDLQLLEALGTHRDVHLWLPQTSATRWANSVGQSASGPIPRSSDESAALVQHPLLASLGRDARELQRSLASIKYQDSPETPTTSRVPTSTLGWLQQDLEHDHCPDGDEVTGRHVAAEDHSIQIHSCHGAARQVEVLRDVLTGLLEDDHTLEPRDILVMCPDIDAYAPLIQAHFGMVDVPDATTKGHPAHQLRVRLADRGDRHTNPLLALTLDLLHLAQSRVSATEVRELLTNSCVQRRFGFDDDHRDQLAEWIEAAGIQWGLDADHRGQYGLSGLAQNSWAFGLDRILTSLVVDGVDVAHIGTASAISTLGSGDIDLAGRFAEFIERLRRALDLLQPARTGSSWADDLTQTVLSLGEVAPDQAWQQTQFEREVLRLEAPGQTTPLTRGEVRAALSDRLAGRPTRANFRTGTLTVCTLVPMRSVPHRVVVLLGLDDQAFPRQTTVRGDDVLARNPVTGERDLRSEDRQLLLDAIMAASDTLIATYTGADEYTGAVKQPAVPIGELIDATRTCVPGDRSVVITHPLHPFDLRNFLPGAVMAGQETPFTFDRPALAGAVATLGVRETAAALPKRLPEQIIDTVSLDDLIAMLTNPFAHFLQRRLGMRRPTTVVGQAHDGIPIELDGLEKWGIADRILQDLMTGKSPNEAIEAERRRGELPPDALGFALLSEVGPTVEKIGQHGRSLLVGKPHSVDLDFDVAPGRRLVGSLPGTGFAGRVDERLCGLNLVRVTYSTIRAKQQITAWVKLLALTVAEPEHDWVSTVVGQRAKKAVALSMSGVRAQDAAAYLKQLVDLYDRGLREPLPMPANTALAYYEGVRGEHPQSASELHAAIKKTWLPSTFVGGQIPGDQDEASVVALWGQGAPISHLLTSPKEHEQWTRGEHTRLGQYALRLWDPVSRGHRNWGLL